MDIKMYIIDKLIKVTELDKAIFKMVSDYTEGVKRSTWDGIKDSRLDLYDRIREMDNNRRCILGNIAYITGLIDKFDDMSDQKLAKLYSPCSCTEILSLDQTIQTLKKDGYL